MFLIVFCLQSLVAQLITKTDSGSISGADFKMLFPANWKGKPVMYAHGYQVKGIVQKFSKGPFLKSAIASTC